MEEEPKPGITTALLSWDADLGQSLVDACAWSTWDSLRPSMLVQPQFLGQDFPMGTLAYLEPLEIVNLIPLVLP